MRRTSSNTSSVCGNIAAIFTDGTIHISSSITEQIELAGDLIRR